MSSQDLGPLHPNAQDFQIKQPAPRIGDSLPSIETPQEFPKLDLSKATAFVTGGNRDIGGAITQALLAKGTEVGSICLRTSSLNKSESLVKAAQAEGHILKFAQADLTTPIGRETAFQLWDEQFGHEPDILVLSTSGQTREINVDANDALLREYLASRQDRIRNGAKLSQGHAILMQSEPGHFFDLLKGAVELPEFYKQVGPVKLDGEQKLSRLMAECIKLGVQFSIVAPPEVSDTGNMKIFNRIDADAWKKSRALSTKLGTTQAIRTDQVGKIVVDLLQRDDLEQGHIELTGGVKDARRKLSLYGDNAIYPHTLIQTEPDKGETRTIVNPKTWERSEPTSSRGELLTSHPTVRMTRVDMTQAHAEGHFRPDVGISIIPGHETFAAAAATGERFHKGAYVISGYERLSFDKPVFPGDQLEIVAEKRTKEPTAPIDATVTLAQTPIVAAEVKGMQFRKVSRAEEHVLQPNQLIELAAQALGSVALDAKATLGRGRSSSLPLFMGTGEATFDPTDLKAGDAVQTIATVTARNKRDITGNVDMYRMRVDYEGDKQRIQRERVASLQEVKFLMVPERAARAVFAPSRNPTANKTV